MGYNYLMYNSKRTLEVFGYDLKNKKRRSKEELKLHVSKVRPRDMLVIDNCPICNVERQIKLNQSRKNKPCSKCFHNTPEMVKAKQNQSKFKSKETRQKMSQNHWLKNGGTSPFKGKTHSEEVITLLKKKTAQYYKERSYEEYGKRYIKGSCTQRGIPIEDFNGFSAPEGTRIRQSAEGKAWSYDVLSKANFTCVKCNERGGKLHAHHLNSFNSHPDQRFDLNNGACLCETCHSSFHEKYGKGDNTEDQFNEWIGHKNEN